MTPDGIVEALRARARFAQAHFVQERLSKPLTAAELNTWIRQACDEARVWLQRVPPDFEFGLFVDGKGRPIAPNFADTSNPDWRVHTGSRGGAWSSSSGISGEMMRAVTERRAKDIEG